MHLSDRQQGACDRDSGRVHSDTCMHASAQTCTLKSESCETGGKRKRKKRTDHQSQTKDCYKL